MVHDCGIFKLSEHQRTPLNTGKTSKVVLKIITYVLNNLKLKTYADCFFLVQFLFRFFTISDVKPVA